MGLLEAFGLAEEVGSRALTFDDLLFMADARKRKGCKTVQRQLKAEEIQRVLELGRKCAAYKEMTR
jgi:hypothetical protein